MSTTLIEQLLASGDAITGSVLRAVAGRDDAGDARPLRLDEFGNLRTKPAEPTLDLFGRQAISEPVALWAMSQQQQAIADLRTVSNVVGGASVAYNSNRVTRVLTVGTASGDQATFQSREYVPYQPGRHHQAIVTGVFGSPVANVTRQMGLFSDENGIFLQQEGDGTVSLVLRSNTSGSVVDTPVAQASWNVDTFDGTGESGKTLDLTKFTVLVIEFGWLGGAGCRISFAQNGALTVVHSFDLTSLAVPFIRIPSLPVRWRILNAAASAGASMDATCGAVYSFGSDKVGGTLVSEVMTAVRSISTTFVPLISVRLKSGFQRNVLDPLSFQVLATSNVYLIAKIVIRPTLTAATTWTATTGATTEFNVDATALTGGIQVADTLVERAGGGAVGSQSIESPLRVSSDYAGTTRDVLTLAVRTVSGTGDVIGGLQWREQ